MSRGVRPPTLRPLTRNPRPVTISQLKDMKHDEDNLDTSEIKTENLYESRT